IAGPLSVSALRARVTALAPDPRVSEETLQAPSPRLDWWSCDPADTFDEDSQRPEIVEKAAAAALNVLYMPAPPRVPV
ncbi:MAG: hypothetical protein K8H87_05675, partial [Pseudorhodoplanes sp.]|nr:hypothetical protein [Pseudorhodoplanes sp.]